MSWVAVGAAAVTVAGSLYSSNQQSKAAKGAANAQQRAADQSNDTQRYMYDTNRQDQMPWLNTGQAALNKLATLYGINTGTPAANQAPATTTVAAGASDNRYPAGGYAPGSVGAVMGQGGGTASGQAGYEQARPVNALAGGIDPRFADFYNSPDYQFALQQGTQTLDRSAAARGRLYSGGYGMDLTKYGQGMASQQLNNYTNRLADIAGLGQVASTNLAGQGQNFANAYGNNLQNAADARSSAYAANANASTGVANGLAQAVGYYGNYRAGSNINNPNGWNYIPPIDNSGYATQNPMQF